MSKLRIISLIIAAAWLALPLLAKDAAQSGPFTGEIMDSQCAKAGTHEEMMKAMKEMGDTAKSCTLKCVEMGGKFVLFDKAGNKTYNLDSQAKAKPFAGDKVTVTGTYDGKKIHVTNIAPGS
jgi:hypothetical protein